IQQNMKRHLRTHKNEGCETIIKDKLTRTNKNRSQLQQLLQKIQKSDTLVITKLDRLARSAMDGIETVKNLFEQGVKVHVLNMGLVEDTPTGRLILNVMLAFAEFERDMIVERTQEGKAIAKQDPSFREGRPKIYGKEQINHALKLKETHTYK